MNNHDDPIRVLHVVGGMNRGGVETWLMHILRHINRERYRMDFLVHTDQPCAYDDEIRTLGSSIVPCLQPSQPWRYANRFLKVLAKHGPYDVIHSHVHHFSGFIVFLALIAGVPIRIAHSHNDTAKPDQEAGLLRHLYLRSTEIALKINITHGLGCSKTAAAALFGCSWSSDRRIKVLRYGIDLEPFQQGPIVQSRPLRRDLGIPPNVFVVGHVGRFAEAKNHKFLLEIFHELVNCDAAVHLLLIGDGPLRPSIESQVSLLDLDDKVTFTGVRSDVPQLMLDAMDAFLFPSLWEGLGIVLIEAQAAGLHCFVSDVIPNEADVVPELIRWLSLESSAKEWAAHLLQIKHHDTAMDPSKALNMVEASPFNIKVSTKKLQGIYDS